ncbi:Valine--tRNA ligase, mitochondrial 1 [Vitis vinifera]|uniref:valine--tRNA ligase n=1 Tax=Vitis vinifera TaxID=29760 RepID=A0A438GWV3_VITVI|nr:Valine--tRNA ligase, mitochondrial 1 [Vitis vinifera]
MYEILIVVVGIFTSFFRRPAYVLCRTDAIAEIINSYELEILTLATLSSLKVSHILQVLNEGDDAPIGCAVSVVNESLSVYLKLQGALNAEAEREKLRKKMEEIRKQQEHLTQIMSASGYQEKVPARIHEENVAKLSSLMQELLSFEQASQHLERDIAAEQESR